MIDGDLYDPQGKVKDKYPYESQDDFILWKNDKRFHIGQGYENKVVDTCYCKHCGGDKFNVGAGSYYTAIRCINCEYEICIHEG